MNKLQRLLIERQNLNQALRQFLITHNYLEAETPLLAPFLIPESYLEVFETKLTSPNLTTPQTAYLLASPEAFLKRLLSAGTGNIFSLSKAFRNGEPLGQKHNHEFTILEWYRVEYDYRQLMREIEQMIGFVAKEVRATIGINFTKPWEYLSVREAAAQFAPKERLSAENFEKVYVQYLEPNLGTRGVPTFIYDYPSWQSPLAKSNNGLAQRFELYINGVELVNGWTELTDWHVQKTNLENENSLRQKQGKEPLPLDYGFIESLKQGMPECAGAALGVDRLLMVLMGYPSIEEVLPFSSRALFGKEEN